MVRSQERLSQTSWTPSCEPRVAKSHYATLNQLEQAQAAERRSELRQAVGIFRKPA